MPQLAVRKTLALRVVVVVVLLLLLLLVRLTSRVVRGEGIACVRRCHHHAVA